MVTLFGDYLSVNITFLLSYSHIRKDEMNKRKELIGLGYYIYNFIISKFKLYKWNIK